MISVRILIIGVFTLVFCISETSVHGLINGIDITNGQFAPHVLLFLPKYKVCGGELISPAHVLTASSCVFNENNELYAPNEVLVSGKWNITIKPIVPDILNIYAAAIYAHSKYDPYSKDNDIAVLRLPVELPLQSNILIPSIAKAVLTSRIVPDETTCSLAGYNVDDTLKGLLFTTLPISNRIECNENGQYAFQIRDTMICAGTTSETNLCANDIGSGLYCNGMLVGILSFGTACGGSAPGVFTQVRMYTEWIKKQMVRYDVPKPGPTPPPTNSGSFIEMSLLLLFISMQFALLRCYNFNI